MRLLIATLICGLLVGLSPPHREAVAGELRSTNDRHYKKGPSRVGRGSFGRAGRKYRTQVVQGQQRGLIVKDPNALSQAAKLDLEASLACREGRLRRLGGGIAAFGDNRYPAGRKRDMSRIEGIELGEDIYIFVNESSTACRVYTYGG